MIPLSIPNFEGNELKYVTDAVGQGWVSTGGAYISRFEEELADFVKTPKAVACQSGTAALHLSLMEAGVKQGDLVIAPALTFIAAVNPIVYMGAEPVFMDCDDSLCMDPVKLESFCKEECDYESGLLIHRSTGKTIRAIVVVHVFGNMADMESIMDIASEYDLKVIEDATEALGSRYTEGRFEGEYAGTIGDFGAYSFNGNKIITTGGGGMVVGKDQSSLEHIRYISTQAKDDPQFYIHNEVGYNYRMTNVQAAIGVAQMELLEEFILRKNRSYAGYEREFSGWDKGRLLSFRAGIYSNKWFYSLCINADNADLKDIVGRLSDQGVQTRLIWGLVNEQKPYQKMPSYRIERAKWYSEHVLNIPCSTSLTEDDIKYVSKTIRENV